MYIYIYRFFSFSVQFVSQEFGLSTLIAYHNIYVEIKHWFHQEKKRYLF